MKLLFIALTAAGLVSTPLFANDDRLRQQATALFGVLPDTMPGAESDTPAMVELGRQLFMDKRLSINDSQSCNTCHNVMDSGPGVDNLPTSPGALGELGDRNSPSVWNAGFHIAQFWDGREKDLESQAKGPILNPIEMAMPDEETVISKLSAIEGYPDAFDHAFGVNGSLTYDNVANAIAAFERTLITRDRFDEFQRGDNAALTEQEKRGLSTFINVGCAACHSGPLLGGNSYFKVGIVEPFPNQQDLGRYEVTGEDSDKMVFKTSALRDIGRTAPYFHDGSVETLEIAVADMARMQLGRTLTEENVEDITAFLRALDHQF